MYSKLTATRVSALCVATFMSGAFLSAQDPFAEEPQASSPAGLDTLGAQTKQPPVVDRGNDRPRDPTAPPAGLLDRIPKPVLPIEPATTVKKTSTRKPTAAPLPKLPKITLRAIVLSTPQRGRAMLDVDGTSVTVSLLQRDQQLRLPIPAAQFAHLKTALDQRAALTAADESSTASKTMKTYEMCLQCSFTAEETIFNVEAFTADAILLRAIPHDTVVLVRRSTR